MAPPHPPRPRVTFTADFREVIEGNLAAGPCILRFDPLRFAPETFGTDGDRKVKAFARFHPGGAEWQGQLLPVKAPPPRPAVPPGPALLLEAEFSLPGGCEALELWFSSTGPAGSVDWDSAFGKNHWIRVSGREAAPEAPRAGGRRGPLADAPAKGRFKLLDALFRRFGKGDLSKR